MQRSSLLHGCQLIDFLIALSRRLHCAWIVVVVCLLTFPSLARAQLVSDRQWVVFRPADGLSSSSTYSVVLHEGALWVGTSSGVSRYDGVWQPFTDVLLSPTTNSESKPLGQVTALAVDDITGTLWACSETGLLARWQEGTGWVMMRNLRVPVHAIAASNDAVWIGSESGLFHLYNGMVQRIPEIGDAPVYAVTVRDSAVWVGGQDALWRFSSDLTLRERHQPRDDSGLLIEGPYTAIWPESADNVWFATASVIGEYFAAGKETIGYPSPFGDDSGEITAIQGVPFESIWITSSSGGAAQYRLSGRTVVSMRSWGGQSQGGLTANNVRDVVIDQDGSVWFATAVGVFRYQPWAFQNIDDHFEALPVYDVLLDKMGRVWVATDGEGVQMRPARYAQPLQYLSDGFSAPGNVVYALEEDEQGRIWAATNRGVAYFEEQAWRQPLALRHLSISPGSDMKADLLGLWIATMSSLWRYRFVDQEVTVDTPTPDSPIIKIELDSIGRLWAASASGYIWRRALDGQWQLIEAIEDVAGTGATVAALRADSRSSGAMLVAFRGHGLYRYLDTGWERIEKGSKFGDERILTVLSDPSTDSIWVGGEGGLSRLDAYGVTRFDSYDGIQPGAVRAIVRSSDGAYWFGGDRGLFYYSPEHGKPWIALKEMRGAEFDPREGHWHALTNTPLEAFFTYGDLQTLSNRLQVFTRVVGEGAGTGWHPLPSDAKSYPLLFEAPGLYTLEYRVRDQAFNYSPVHTVSLAVAPAPSYISLPLLGSVEVRIFQLLILFAAMALIGFGYVSVEIIQQRRRVSEAIARGYNPYISGEPIRSAEMFFGRRELLQRIVSTLHNNSIMIHGERRIGKTTLLYQLANALRSLDDPDYWFIAVYIDLEGTTEAAFFHFLMEEIAHNVDEIDDLDSAHRDQLKSLTYHTLPAEEYRDRDFSRDLRRVIEILEAYGAFHYPGKRLRLILLMDEMDTLSHFNHLTQQQLRRIFMREFAASLGAVVAGIEISKEWERVESPWFNLFNEIAMQPFSREESIQLLVEPVRGYYIYEPDALEFILDQCEGRPFRLQQYGLEAVNEMLRHKRRRITVQDVRAAHERIELNVQPGAEQLGTNHAALAVTAPVGGAYPPPQALSEGGE